MADGFIGQIDETHDRLCGLIRDEVRCFTITELEDEIIDREYSVHAAYDDNAPDTTFHLLMTREEAAFERNNTAVHRTVAILEEAKGRSVHFPKLVFFGKVRQLIFGEDCEQQYERDPEWRSRPFAILEHEGVPLGSLLGFAPGGVLGMKMSLVAGLGCVRALAALHRLGYVHRLVTPYSLSYPIPLSYDALDAGLLFTDVSLCLKWPCKPRTYVPFVGSMRYSSTRVHRGREQGPSDDIISVIYMVAEFISGRLPWRSVTIGAKVCEMKASFYLSPEFKRLPREIRFVFRKMYMTSSQEQIDHKEVIGLFQAALSRRCHSDDEQLPKWALMPAGGV